jgi:CHAT domain
VTDTQELQISIAPHEVFFRAAGAEHVGAPSFDDDTLETLARLRREGASEDYGHELFRATFTGDLEEGYRRARHEVEQARARWRLRLDIPEHEERLHALWWECLFDDRPTKKPLATLGGTLVSRYLTRDDGAPALEAERLRLLLVIASPHDLGTGRWDGLNPLEEGTERWIVEDALKGLGDVLDVEVLKDGASLGRIRRRLRDDGVNILHVVAHGSFDQQTQKGSLLLETDEGERTAEEDEDRLSQLVDDLPNLRLVVLSAGEQAPRASVDPFVRLAPKMVYSGVSAVVAMQDSIGADAARTFTKHFYRSLLTSRDADGMVDAAMTIARDELFFNTPKGGWDWAVPVLYMRGEGRLFAPFVAKPEQREAAGGATVLSAAPAAPAAPEPAQPPAPAQPLASAPTTTVEEPAGGELRLSGADREFLIDHMDGLSPEDFETAFERLRFLMEIPADELTGSPLERVIALVQRCEDEGKVERLAKRIHMLRKGQGSGKEARPSQITFKGSIVVAGQW